MSDERESSKKMVPGQNWAVVNIIGPGLRQQTNKTSLRVLGIFSKPELANAYIEEYKRLDDRFDMYLMAAGEFLPIPTEVHEAGEVKYDQAEINDLLDVHEKTRTQAEAWDTRIKNAHETKKDSWGLEGL